MDNVVGLCGVKYGVNSIVENKDLQWADFLPILVMGTEVLPLIWYPIETLYFTWVT